MGDDVHERQQVRHVGSRAKKAQRSREAARGCLTHEVLPHGAIADEQRNGVGDPFQNERPRVEEVLVALVGDKVGDDPDDGCRAWNTE